MFSKIKFSLLVSHLPLSIAVPYLLERTQLGGLTNLRFFFLYNTVCYQSSNSCPCSSGVERITRNDEVRGSNPRGGNIFYLFISCLFSPPLLFLSFYSYY